MCFEILGFDVMIDENANPWVIEVNHAPSFTTDTPLDFKIKKAVITDAISLLNLNWKKRYRYKQLEKIKFQKRVLSGKQTRPSIPQKLIQRAKKNEL